jgi:hypothetical protein
VRIILFFLALFLEADADCWVDRHVQYWAQFPDQKYEHERFLSGFEAGWNANYRYFDSLNPDDPKVSEVGKSDFVLSFSPHFFYNSLSTFHP